jgi:hypothetical protein
VMGQASPSLYLFTVSLFSAAFRTLMVTFAKKNSDDDDGDVIS